jgi:hypothetical protein
MDVDPDRAKEFVYGDKTRTDQPGKTPDVEVRDGKGQPPVGRVPFTTRVRTDYSAALKRASLERQLAGRFPNTLQDILEEALEPWLRANGYIT